MIVPSALQVPPREFVASQRVTAAPPAIEIFFSLSRVKKPIHWPSGEKNGLMASVVSGSGDASS
jgi:hypothetical protein